MKKLFTLLFLAASIATLPFTLTSCGDDEPETSSTNQNASSSNQDSSSTDQDNQFAQYVGYWINSDNTTALEISQQSGNSSLKIKSYSRASSGTLHSHSSTLTTISNNNPFGVINTNNNVVSVCITTVTSSKLLLQKYYSSGNSLSSYTFTYASEREFENFLEGNQESGSSGSDTSIYTHSDIIGTWNATSSTDIDLSYTKISLTFLTDGTVIEKDTPVDDPNDYETFTGNFTQKGEDLYLNIPRGILDNYLFNDLKILELSGTWLQIYDSVMDIKITFKKAN